MSTAPYSFRMDAELRKSLEREAKIEGVPASQMAAQAVRAMVQARVARRAAIDAALAEADAGAFISEDAMNRWIDSWGASEETPMPEPDIAQGR